MSAAWDQNLREDNIRNRSLGTEEVPQVLPFASLPAENTARKSMR